MRRILFVDDEPRVLQGLQRMLFDYCDEWEMAFVTSGQEAIEELAKQSFDVLVTDMRMPGMDGAALLRYVQERHPNLVRIVLSGHTELEAALRAMPMAHQFLSKPCEARVLMGVLQRACNLQLLINDELVRGLVGSVADLPARPGVYAALSSALVDETASNEKLAAIVQQDVAISTKLLHVVNSAFFSPRRRITTVQDSISLLGTRMLRDLVLSIEVFQYSMRNPVGFSMETLSRSGLLVGAIAKRMVGPAHGDDAFLAGMLHDVGILVLATRMPGYFDHVIQNARSNGSALCSVELELKGVTHAEIGAYLLGLWGMPYPVVEAVANHHSTERNRGRGLDVATAVQVSQLLVREVLQNSCTLDDSPLDENLLSALGIQADLQQWRTLAADLVTR